MDKISRKWPKYAKVAKNLIHLKYIDFFLIDFFWKSWFLGRGHEFFTYENVEYLKWIKFRVDLFSRFSRNFVHAKFLKLQI